MNTFEIRSIGSVSSSLRTLDAAPRQADEGAPEAWLVFEPEAIEGLRNIRAGDDLILITWLDRARRDVLTVHPRGDASRPPEGVFSTRSPHRLPLTRRRKSRLYCRSARRTSPIGGMMRVRTKVAPLFAGAALLVCAATSLGAQSTFSPRPQTPRVAPLSKEQRTPEQQELLASRPDFNVYKTFAHHVDLYNRWSPLGRFVMTDSSMPPREREIVMLRMGWLCQSEYEWAQHARIAKAQAGLSDEDVHRIAEGLSATGWSEFERTLLRMVDELRYEAMISDATWKALRTKYSAQQVIEAIYTAAQYQLVSMALNSLGVQLDPGLEDRLPKDVRLPALATQPKSPRLKQARVPALPESEWSDEQRKLVATHTDTRPVLNLYATMLNHPVLYGPRVRFGSYLQRDSLLPPKTRELLIMRTAVLTRTEYEWGHHVEAAQKAGFSDEEIRRIAAGPDAPGWSEEHAAVLRAADELRREAFVSDRTWATLAKYYDTKRLIEIIYTSGGYTMTALAINSLGIQLEPGYPSFP